MSPGECARRIAIWAVPALSIGVGLAAFVASGETFLLVGWSGFSLVGAFILTARPRNGVGRALLAIGIIWIATSAALFPLRAFGGALPHDVQALLSITENVLGYLAFVILAIVVLVFPSGRVTTRLGRGVRALIWCEAALITLTAALVPSPDGNDLISGSWAIPALAPLLPVLNTIVALGVPVLVVGSFVDLCLRWRRAIGVERLQFRWFAFGVSIVVVEFVVDQTWQTISPTSYAAFAPFEWIPQLLLNAIPITIGIAVTRHGLYEINRVISRTVAYSIVTAAAVGVYAAVVSSVTFVLPNAPSFAVAAATLAAAALFLPVLRAVQRRLDRRFDRERYDARKVVDEFGERLRGDADPTGITPDLIRAVDKALQPSTVGVWTGTPQRTDRDSARATRS